jgi:hypothetical protein
MAGVIENYCKFVFLAVVRCLQKEEVVSQGEIHGRLVFTARRFVAERKF